MINQIGIKRSINNDVMNTGWAGDEINKMLSDHDANNEYFEQYHSLHSSSGHKP